MKKSIIVLVFLSLLVSSCAGTKYKNANNSAAANTAIKSPNKSVKKDKEQNRDLDVENQEEVEFSDYKVTKDNSGLFSLTEQIISTATDNLGIKYRAGGTTKAGFDCS